MNTLDLLLLTFLVDVSEDVIKDKVSGWLLSENEGLDELLELGRLVGGLTNDLDDNVVEGSLRVNVGDTDFAVLEVQLLDALLDGLQKIRPLGWALEGAYLHCDQQKRWQARPRVQKRIEIAFRRRAASH